MSPAAASVCRLHPLWSGVCSDLAGNPREAPQSWVLAPASCVHRSAGDFSMSGRAAPLGTHSCSRRRLQGWLLSPMPERTQTVMRLAVPFFGGTGTGK